MENFIPICKMCYKSHSIIEFRKSGNGRYYDCCRKCVNYLARKHYNQIKENRKDIFGNR